MQRLNPRISKIVVAIDYSELAELALDAAMLTAEELGQLEVHALAVAEREGPRLPEQLTYDVKQKFLDEATKTLNDYLERVRGISDDVIVTPHVAFGDPKERILELASALQAGLIVVGTHGRRGVERLLLGSVAENVIRHASCPVLALHNAGAAAKTREGGGRAKALAPRRIGVAVDFSLGSRNALEEAGRWATLFHADLVVLHILEPAQFVSADSLSHVSTTQAPVEDYTRGHARERLEAFCNETLGENALRVRPEVQEGIARDAILRAARHEPFDWLVIGTHGRRGIRRALLGSVAEAVMRQCPCPFLAVHTDADEA